MVLGAGNKERVIHPPLFGRPKSGDSCAQIMGHLIEALDPETRQSVLMAGAFDPETNAACDYSNKPGDWVEAQERFLFAPGRHFLSYEDRSVGGTPFAAP
ncbi:MAG: hypothetical protein H0X26_03365 [Alphaproteobacteria bacterium]|nr:hypothetical protein [Alphaproteobacteria bacterium]